GVWRVQSLHGDAWHDLYEFSLERWEHADYEMASHYTSTHPQSRFIHTLIAQHLTPQARYLLRNRELTVDRGTGMETRTLAADDELLDVLGGTFGLRFPAGTRFNYRD